MGQIFHNKPLENFKFDWIKYSNLLYPSIIAINNIQKLWWTKLYFLNFIFVCLY